MAYAIAERFYGGVHYAWCSPVFDGTTTPVHINIPPTSSPAELYRNLWQEVRRGEMHSAAIKQNREGILRGARSRLDAGLISSVVYDQIVRMLNYASVADFRAILYVIPFDRVADRAAEVEVEERAHPLSPEYRVEHLPRECFDMIELRN